MGPDGSHFFMLVAVAAMAVSCQEESSVEDSSGALSPDSSLTYLLGVIAENPTNTQTVIDNVPCFNIKLPVTVTANSQVITVTNANDYAAVEAVFDQSSTDTDQLGYVFPLTVAFPDYTEVVVSSQSQFNALANNCNDSNTYMDSNCIAINYPFKLYAYNSSFQVENTYDMDTSKELYTFIKGLQANQFYSLNYPMSITIGGQALVIGNNAQFQASAQSALAACNINIPGEPGCDNPGVLLDDLILYMTFSNSVADLKGSDVTPPAQTTFVADRDGNAQCALSFNGSQQIKVISSAENSIVQGNAFSISIWFRMQNTEMGDYEHMFRKGLQGEAGFNLSVFDGNTPLFAVPSAQVWDNNWNQDADLWQDTENWHHLVLTFDVNNTARLYRDGVLQNSENFSANTGATALDYYIGQDFTGFLDDLRVYRKTLSEEEVQTLFELEGDC
ncbi:MAG: LamG domain-containing protein, partial [Sphingobacteriales bacterium]